MNKKVIKVSASAKVRDMGAASMWWHARSQAFVDRRRKKPRYGFREEW